MTNDSLDSSKDFDASFTKAIRTIHTVLEKNGQVVDGLDHLIKAKKLALDLVNGSTDHRGTPAYPGRTVTLESSPGEVCYLEVREKQYDEKAYVDFFTDPMSTTPAVSGVMVYIASPDKNVNKNYLGPASLEEMANQIVKAEGPSGPNRDYLFQLEKALLQFGCEDNHVMDQANAVRKILKEVNINS